MLFQQNSHPFEIEKLIPRWMAYLPSGDFLGLTAVMETDSRQN